MKQFITNGEVAGILLVIAATDTAQMGIKVTAFIVGKGTPSFSTGKCEDKMGIRFSVTNELLLADCEVAEVDIVGETTGEGKAFVAGADIAETVIAAVNGFALGVGC